MIGTLLILAIAVIVAVAVLTTMVIVLVKLGIIARYALNPDKTTDEGDYELKQSQPSGK